MANIKSVKSDIEPLIKSIGEYVKKVHGAPDAQTKDIFCDIVCAGGCAAICAITDAIGTAVGSAGGKSIAANIV